MEGKVLVAYASKYRAAAEIAEKIGRVLGDTGLLVDLSPAKNITTLTLP